MPGTQDYNNLDNVPSKTAGSSPVLAQDWNTYVQGNFNALKYGHLVVDSSDRPSGIEEGTMIYESNTNKILMYSGTTNGWIELIHLDNFASASATGGNATWRAVPTGTVNAFAGPATGSPPAGWLFCNGNAVSRTTYADLYAVIGQNTYGTDPAGQFYLPDLRGRVISMVDNTGVTDANNYPTRLRPITADAATLGKVVGDSRLHAHNHNVGSVSANFAANGYTTSTGDHNHNHTDTVTASAGGLQLANGSYWPRIIGSDINRGTTSAGPHNHNVYIAGSFSGGTGATSSAGGAGGSNNIPPTVMMNYIIKY